MASRVREALSAVKRGAIGHPRVQHPVCHDLAGWVASTPGAERHVVEPGFTTTRPLPETIEPEVDAGFSALCSVDVPERAVVKIPNARIRGDFGLVVLPDGQFVGELVALTPAGRLSMLEREPAYYEPLGRRPVRKSGNFYAVLGFGVSHYYHWSHDLIMGMRGIGHLLPADTQLVVPPEMRPFQTETLDLLGLDDHPRVPFPAGADWELENLYVVTPRLKTQIDSPEPFRWFRDTAMARHEITAARPTRRLYVSRRLDGHWRATNEDEVEELLTGFGFETVVPATLTFREQMDLFRHAEAIVGTGAGLFNMVFSPPEAKVLQFQEPTHYVHALWTEAAALGLEYHYVLCDPVANPGAANADIHVPVAKLEAAVRAMIGA